MAEVITETIGCDLGDQLSELFILLPTWRRSSRSAALRSRAARSFERVSEVRPGWSPGRERSRERGLLRRRGRLDLDIRPA